MVADLRGRMLRDLRISVTDRCNLRCTYCMPKEHFSKEHDFLPRSEILDLEEIALIVESLLPIGLKKVRLTGGEPLLRRDVSELVKMIRKLSQDLDVSLTTNGVLLTNILEDLIASGLDRITISLDAINSELFKKMSDSNSEVEQVVLAIEKCLDLGLPLKINTVIQAGVNEDQIIPIIERFAPLGIEVRFIEFMDVGTTNRWKFDDVVTGEQMREIISKRLGELTPLNPINSSDVARMWISSQGYKIGFIESISKPFCGDCTRLRLSAHGSLYTCLFNEHGNDIKAMIRMGASKEEIRRATLSIWGSRKDNYSEVRENNTKSQKVEMSFIGG